MNKEQIAKAIEHACQKYSAYLAVHNKPIHCPAQEFVEPKDSMRETLETLLDKLGLESWRKELEKKIIYQNTRYEFIIQELIGEELVKETDPRLRWQKYSEIYNISKKILTIPIAFWIVNEDWIILARKFKTIFRPCNMLQPYEVSPFRFLDYFDVCESVKPESLFGAISFILDGLTDFSGAELDVHFNAYDNKSLITGAGSDGTHRIYAAVLLAPLVEKIRLHMNFIEINGFKLKGFLNSSSITESITNTTNGLNALDSFKGSKRGLLSSLLWTLKRIFGAMQRENL